MTKLIVAGGREYKFTEADIQRLNQLLPVDEVVSGCAHGADTEGELWAESHNIPVTRFPALWEKYGKAAGYIRNKIMAKYANAVALFPGGRGTQSMFVEATKAGIKIYDYR